MVMCLEYSFSDQRFEILNEEGIEHAAILSKQGSLSGLTDKFWRQVGLEGTS